MLLTRFSSTASWLTLPHGWGCRLGCPRFLTATRTADGSWLYGHLTGVGIVVESFAAPAGWWSSNGERPICSRWQFAQFFGLLPGINAEGLYSQQRIQRLPTPARLAPRASRSNTAIGSRDDFFIANHLHTATGKTKLPTMPACSARLGL